MVAIGVRVAGPLSGRPVLLARLTMLVVDLYKAEVVQGQRTRTMDVPEGDWATICVSYAVHSPEVLADPTFRLDSELWALFPEGWLLLSDARFPESPVSIYRGPDLAPASRIRIVFEPTRPASISATASFTPRV